MASVVISRGVSASDRADAVPRELWEELIEARRDYCRNAIVDDCRLIIQFASDAESVGWLGYATKEEYLRDGLGLDPQVVEWALEGLTSLGIDEPVALPAAADTGRKLRAKPGRPSKADIRNAELSDSNYDNINISSPSVSGGTSRSYTVARLERDRPDLAEQVKSGVKSANAAAIEAGFRKRPTPLDQLRSAWRRATQDEREQFLDEVNG